MYNNKKRQDKKAEQIGEQNKESASDGDWMKSKYSTETKQARLSEKLYQKNQSALGHFEKSFTHMMCVFYIFIVAFVDSR